MDISQWIAIHSALRYRLAAGVIIFGLLALSDVVQHRRQATRWREYLFLVVCTAAAMVFGALNDQVTCAISWEYFYYGKELAPILGAGTPPDAMALHWQAARIGAEATWTAGLILGAVLLIANNRQQNLPQLPYSRMLAMLAIPLGCCLVFALVFGVVGACGGLNFFNADFGDMWQSNVFRPRHFTGVYGIHLGDYVGGSVGAILAAVRVRVLRKRRQGV